MFYWIKGFLLSIQHLCLYISFHYKQQSSSNASVLLCVRCNKLYITLLLYTVEAFC